MRKMMDTAKNHPTATAFGALTVVAAAANIVYDHFKHGDALHDMRKIRGNNAELAALYAAVTAVGTPVVAGAGELAERGFKKACGMWKGRNAVVPAEQQPLNVNILPA